MKTSNKLLLFFSLLALGIFTTIHLGLYASYRSGRIVSPEEISAEQFDSHSVRSPKWISIKGLMHVRLIPADSCRIEFEKDNAELVYRQSGDSLIISGWILSSRYPHDSWNNYWNIPWVNIFYNPSSMAAIRAEGCFIATSNEKGTGNLQNRFILQDTQLWIGEFNPMKDSDPDYPFQEEPFDSLHIESVNSTIVINKQSRVHALSMHLDDHSEFIDRFSKIDTGAIYPEPTAKITLTGRNFNNVKITPSEKN